MLVGLLVGCIQVLLIKILQPFLPHQLLCCVLILSLAAISGFLHLDGLADTADGFFSSRPREQILQIMKDSRNGAMGIIGILFILLFKYAALTSIPPGSMVQIALLMPLAGRGGIILTMYLLPYAREEGGLGQLFYVSKGWVVPFYSLCFLVPALIFAQMKVLLLCCGTVVAASLFFAHWCKKKIGGATGDTLGAICEISETAAAVSVAIYLN